MIRPPTLEQEGFVHCATAQQVAGVIERFFPEPDDVWILTLDPSGLGPAVRWEGPVDPRTGLAEPGVPGVFPHIYDAIPRTAVVGARPWAARPAE